MAVKEEQRNTKKDVRYTDNYSRMADINLTISKIALNMNTGIGKNPKKWRLRKVWTGYEMKWY